MTRQQRGDPQQLRDPDVALSRRALVQGLTLCAGATVAGAGGALAQGGPQGGPQGPAAPPSTITSPPRDFGPGGAPTTYFWDPDIIAVDPSFNNLAQPNTAITRLHTGLLWTEGPAWSGHAADAVESLLNR